MGGSPVMFVLPFINQITDNKFLYATLAFLSVVSVVIISTIKLDSNEGFKSFKYNYYEAVRKKKEEYEQIENNRFEEII